MELKELKPEMDDSVGNEIGALAKDVHEKSMPCTSNFEDHSFYGEDLSEDRRGCGDDSRKKEVYEVDILECTDVSGNEFEAPECNDGTDVYSSSFSGTVSESETGTGLDDQEADSAMCTDTVLPLWVRKKKLTDHYRRSRQPIMWRCKWLELKIKELKAQARMYDKEIEGFYQAKQFELENLKSEERGIKALPFPCHTKENRLMKRRNRKRVEETKDIPSYMSNHNLFSYYEYRKSLVDGVLNDNSRNLDKRYKSNKDEPVFCEETPPLELKEGDAYLEQILLKIEAAKSEARSLKNRADKVLSEIPKRYSSVNSLNLLGPTDVFTSLEQKPQLLTENENEKPVISEEKPANSVSLSSHHDTPEDDTDILLSDIIASRRREAKAVPDKKLQNDEKIPFEGPSRNARKRTPRNLEVKEETTKRCRVSKEKPKSNTLLASRFKLPNRKKKRGKRKTGSSVIRRRS